MKHLHPLVLVDTCTTGAGAIVVNKAYHMELPAYILYDIHPICHCCSHHLGPKP